VKHNSLHIPQHVRCRDTQNPDTLADQPGITVSIANRCVTTPMHFPIDLDRKAMTGTKEIQHIAASRMLSPKTQPGGTLAQFLPQQHFGEGHRLAQATGAMLHAFGTMEHDRSLPLRLACGQPPPLSGEDFSGTIKQRLCVA